MIIKPYLILENVYPLDSMSDRSLMRGCREIVSHYLSRTFNFFLNTSHQQNHYISLTYIHYLLIRFHMKKYCLFLCFTYISLCHIFASDIKIPSPDGSIILNISNQDSLFYATIYFIVPMVLYNYWFIQTQKAHPTDAL